MNLSDPSTLLLCITALYGAGGAVGLFPRAVHKRLKTCLALACALAAGMLVACSAVEFWRQPMRQGQTLLTLLESPPAIPFPALRLDLYVDRLAAFFMLLTGLLSSGVALYSFAWLSDKQEQHRIAGVYNLFVLSTLLLLLVNNVYLFLVCLECMTLAFSYLTLYKHNTLLEQKPGFSKNQVSEAKLAFKAYLVFSHVGVVFITAAFILLALGAGDLGFDALRRASLENRTLASAIFILALAGLGIKGGFAPAHPWVSLVHPRSPTTTHALTLGLVIKISSFYGLLRVFFEFLPPGPWWWGLLTLLLAGLTALVGVFYAITSRDLKTALSNHSVENFGIILAGLGLALLLLYDKSPAPALSGLALTAALYHLLNHTVFKGLLYLCTGAIERQIGTVHLEELGGLMRRLPWTAAAFLVGAVAIAGFPPLNGFISEWLTLQVIFASQGLFDTVHPWLVIGVFGALLMLALALGLTALAFVKIAGEALLGAPRRPDLLAQARPGDAPWSMRLALLVLALLCLLLGLLPGLVVDQLAQISQELLDMPLQGLQTTPTSLSLRLETYSAQIFMLPLLALAALPLLLAALATMRHRRGRKRGPLWNCGADYRPGAMQITGGAFAFLSWVWASGPVPAPSQAERVPWRLRLSQNRYVREDFRRALDSAVQRLLGFSERFGAWFQGGDIRRYLGYLFIVFILALIVSALWQGN
jgi:hydrogenase-4 component B